MRRAACLLLALLGLAGAAFAQEAGKESVKDKAEAEIRAAFAQWTQDFNARRADKVCGLYAKDLVSNYRGVPERGHERQCQILQAALTDDARRFQYALDIKEILVFGDVAVVRLVWTLTIRRADGSEVTIVEPSLDVFRKEPDGQWRIFRYLSFDEG
jgi:steroid delta-isomerase